jgi:hypothetical protein
MNIPVFDALTGDLRYILTFRFKGIEGMRSFWLPRAYLPLVYSSPENIGYQKTVIDEFGIRFEALSWPPNKLQGKSRGGPPVKSKVILADPELLSALDTLAHWTP